MKVFGVIGWKNSGKTSLMERLVTDITARGLTVSTVKHVHHDVDLDQQGKDTFRHRAAGAVEVVLASANRFALMHEHRGLEPALAEILSRLAPVDLVLVEGYKRDSHPKIEVFRRETGHALIQPTDPTTRAVATDADLGPLSVPVLDLNDTKSVADFILGQTGLLPAQFDTVIIVDWSAASTRSPVTPSANAIWVGHCTNGQVATRYHRSRHDAEIALNAVLDAEAAAGHRTLLGFDFAMGYPTGFATALTGSADPRAVWAWLNCNIVDAPDNWNNRLDVAVRINQTLGGRGPFWVVNAALARDGLPYGKIGKVDFAGIGLSEFRHIETSGLAGRAKSVWQLTGPGAVGSQSLMGLPLIHRLSQRPRTAVWPFDPPHARTVIAEVYPSLLAAKVAKDPANIKDEAQVRLLALAIWRLSQAGRLAPLLDLPNPDVAREEGWIVGAGHHNDLARILS